MAGTGFLISLIMLAVGAVLKFAVADRVEGVELGTIGLIVIVAGIIGLLGSMIAWFSEQRERRTLRTDVRHEELGGRPPR